MVIARRVKYFNILVATTILFFLVSVVIGLQFEASETLSQFQAIGYLFLLAGFPVSLIISGIVFLVIDKKLDVKAKQ